MNKAKRKKIPLDKGGSRAAAGGFDAEEHVSKILACIDQIPLPLRGYPLYQGGFDLNPQVFSPIHVKL
jgi:hypothetical protein